MNTLSSSVDLSSHRDPGCAPTSGGGPTLYQAADTNGKEMLRRFGNLLKTGKKKTWEGDAIRTRPAQIPDLRAVAPGKSWRFCSLSALRSRAPRKPRWLRAGRGYKPHGARVCAIEEPEIGFFSTEKEKPPREKMNSPVAAIAAQILARPSPRRSAARRSGAIGGFLDDRRGEFGAA